MVSALFADHSDSHLIPANVPTATQPLSGLLWHLLGYLAGNCATWSSMLKIMACCTAAARPLHCYSHCCTAEQEVTSSVGSVKHGLFCH
jgi:hypothetical protein